MAVCPANCDPITILTNPDSCELKTREVTPAGIIVFPCDLSLPNPMPGSMEPLFASGQIAISSQLANITFSDPTTEDVQVADCLPTRRRIVSREITFEDRVAVSATVGSPATTDEYYDYAVWSDWLEKQTRLRAGLYYCNGDVRLFRDPNGGLASFDLMGFINYTDLSGGVRIEFKSFSMLFNGDPLGMSAPDFNLVDEGVWT